MESITLKKSTIQFILRIILTAFVTCVLFILFYNAFPSDEMDLPFTLENKTDKIISVFAVDATKFENGHSVIAENQVIIQPSEHGYVSIPYYEGEKTEHTFFQLLLDDKVVYTHTPQGNWKMFVYEIHDNPWRIEEVPRD